MLDDEELQRVYTCVDEIPLSRPKRSIARDFADGVLVAEIVHHYFPKMIELHNYSGANGYAQKIYNWCVYSAPASQLGPPDCDALTSHLNKTSPVTTPWRRQEHTQPEGLQEDGISAAEGGDGRAV